MLIQDVCLQDFSVNKMDAAEDRFIQNKQKLNFTDRFQHSMSLEKIQECSKCKTKIRNAKTIVEVNIESYCRYFDEEFDFANPDLFWIKSSEYLCEKCFFEFCRLVTDFFKD